MHSKLCAALLAAVVVLAIGCGPSPVAPTQTVNAIAGGTTQQSGNPAAGATTASGNPAAGGTTTSGNPAAGGTTTSRTMHEQDVPFKGVVTGEAVFDFATNPKGCASTFTTITTAKGQVSHMGLTTWQSQHCLGESSEILDAELVLTAANGDQIHATYTGSCAGTGVIGEPVICSGDAVISGGTGRFENASGTADWSAAIVFEGFTDFSWPGRWEWKGRITY